MDQKAKSRIMSSAYKGNDGRSTAFSERAQSAADRNYPQHSQGGHSSGDGGGQGDGGGWCTIL